MPANDFRTIAGWRAVNDYLNPVSKKKAWGKHLLVVNHEPPTGVLYHHELVDDYGYCWIMVFPHEVREWPWGGVLTLEGPYRG